MNKKIFIAVAIALVGIVAARVSGPRFGLFGSAIGPDTSNMTTARQSALSGDLTMTVIEQDGNGYRVRAELQGGRLNETPATKADIQSSLNKPFYFTVDKSGEMGSFFFAKDLPEEARQLLKQVATSTQAVVPGGTQAAWHTTERDVSGVYQADYSANGNTVTRNKTNYLHARSLDGLVPIGTDTKYGVQSTATYELASSGWPQSASSSESFDVDVHGVKLVASSQTSATLTASVSAPQLVKAMPAAEVESEAVADQHTAAIQAFDSAKNTVKGRTFDQIIADLKAKAPQTRNSAEWQLRALFQIDPRSLDQAEDIVLNGTVHDDNFMRRVIGALSEADTSAAQAKLISIAKRGSEARQMDAIIALGLVSHPTADSGAALQLAMSSRGADKLTSTATLALGNMARRMEAFHTGDPKSVIAPVIEQLQRSSDTHEQTVAVESLGNWGVAAALPMIQPYLSSKDVTQRAAAIVSLRYIKGDAADQAIAAALGDKETKIRKAAAGTIEYRPATALLPTIESTIKAETDKDVAMILVRGLRARRQETPAVMELLHWIADNHSIPEVKKAAKGALGQST